ncbi:MAG TPA: SprT family zinc-dependent metalloprotease [Bacteroidales bacterium]|jgi:predicted metal-dependent hydrolase|nr:SprT family zinc-dependent metalloprotease [Bacteroidales bacterium]
MNEIKYKVIYSSRRTLGISILPDASVTVRVPYRTPEKTILKMVNDKASWIQKHSEKFRNRISENPPVSYSDGDKHPFRGKSFALRIEKSSKPYCRFLDENIEIGTAYPDKSEAVRYILQQGYRREANFIFPSTLKRILEERSPYGFQVTRLNIRSMKSRWGSCSNKGVISLNTELIKLPAVYLEYVILHELCHLKHHNHGEGFYMLLEELFPDWKKVRKELKGYTLR